MTKEAAALNAQFAMMQQQLARMDTTIADRIRSGGVDAAGNQYKGMKQMLQESGAFRVESVRAQSAVENFTTALQKRDVTVQSAMRNTRLFNDVLKEQYALQRMHAQSWTRDARNRVSADAIIPRNVPERLGSFSQSMREAYNGTARFGDVVNETRMRVGLFSEITRSAGHNLVNLGKNTQWAGRQMMVGIGVPMAAFGVAAGVMAYEVDKQLTRIARVYDYTTENVKAEGQTLRDDAMHTAKTVASAYGMAVTDTLEITAQLAATGQTGKKLMQDTQDIAALSVMGELDRQDAIDAAITYNTVFGDSLIELGDAYKYLNMLENETIVSSQDMVTAIPKVAGVVKGLGGDITDVGILMSAARAAGINASEAANTLKSISFRNIAPPAKAVRVFEDLTKLDYNHFVEQTEGSVIPLIQSISKALAPLDRVSRMRVLKELEGLWQGGKAANIFNAMFDFETGEMNEQVRRAVEVGAAGAEEWGSVWDRELTTMQESASNKFKRMAETIKAQLAEVGEPFLQAATMIGNKIADILRWFNGLDEGTKKFWLIFAGATAVGTVLVMLLGVFLNLAGTIVRTAGSLGMMLTRFKSVNMEQKMAELTARATSGAFLTQAESAAVLASNIARANQMLQEQIILQRNAALPPGFIAAPTVGPMMGPTRAPTPTAPVGGVYQDARGQSMMVGQFGANPATAAQVAGARQEAHLLALAEQKQRDVNAVADKARGIFRGQAVAIAGAVGMMGMLVGGTNDLIHKASTAAITFAMLAPVMAGPLSRGVGKVAVGLKSWAPGVAAVGGSLKAVLPMLGPLGAVAAALGAAWFVIHKNMEKARKEQEALNNSAKDWASVLNFEYKEAGARPGEEGDEDTLTERVKKLQEANGTLVDSLRNFSGTTAEARDRAIAEGLKVSLHGGTKEAAEEAAATAYQIINGRMTDLEKEQWILNLGIDFGDAEQVIDRQFKNIDQAMRDATNNDFEQGWTEDFARWFSSGSQMNTRAGQVVRDSAKEMWNMYETSSEEEKNAVFQNIRESLEQGLYMVWNNADDKVLEKLRKEGITSVKDFKKTLTELDPAFRASFLRRMGFSGDEMDRTKRALDVSTEGLRALAEATALFSKEELDNINFDALAEKINVPEEGAEGLKKMAGAADEAVDGIAATADKMEELRGKIDSMAESAAKSRITSAMNMVAAEADRILDERHQNNMRGIQSRHEAVINDLDAENDRLENENRRASNELEDNWKQQQKDFKRFWEDRKQSVEEFYDAQKSALEDQIEAEQEAERVRQRIFENERRRVERLADLYNQNVDFNVALRTGDLDEAARIGNNIRATTEGWAIEDTAEGAKTASERRIEAAQERIDLIEEEKKARLEALEVEREAAEEAMRQDYEIRKQALDNEKEINRQSVEDRKNAEKTKQKAAEDAAQKAHDALKRSLEWDLAAWKAYIPQTEEGLRNHIVTFEGIYNKHDQFLGDKAGTWSQYVTAAMKHASDEAKSSLQSDIDWALYGEHAAADFIQGAFGMDMNAFRQTFGIPGASGGSTFHQSPNAIDRRTAANHSPGGARPAADRYFPHTGGHLTNTGLVYHGGGRVKMQGNRTGYPATAARRPSEVDTRLKVGEFVVNDKAVRKVGVDNLQQINRGILPTATFHDGGAVGGNAKGALGMPGVMGAMMAGMLRTIMQAGFNRMAGGMAGGGFGGAMEPGVFGDVKLDAEQLSNALAIVNTGRSMQMTHRDITIALMTALQESSLRNVAHGDQAGPDSRGLFQQRAPWGPEAVRMDPNGSARLFFEALKKVANRNEMPMGQAAQKVQRSAFPGAYAKWQNEAEALLAMMGGSLGGGTFQRNGNWPPPVYGRVAANTQAAVDYVRQRWGINNIGTLGQRANASDHPFGKALDVMIPNYRSPQGIALGNAIASWFVQNPDAFGTKYVIWRQMINSGKGWRRMEDRGNDTANHLDHPHISLLHGGGMASIPEMRQEGIPPRGMGLLGGLPQLFAGGEIRYDNTIANLHKNEKVLTAPLSAELERGIGNLANGGANEYNITMDLRGSTIDSNFDIDEALEQAIRRRESRLGRNRKIT